MEIPASGVSKVYNINTPCFSENLILYRVIADHCLVKTLLKYSIRGLKIRYNPDHWETLISGKWWFKPFSNLANTTPVSTILISRCLNIMKARLQDAMLTNRGRHVEHPLFPVWKFKTKPARPVPDLHRGKNKRWPFKKITKKII